MKSPSRMSELIRAKKLLMKNDQDVIEPSSQKMDDLQDVEIARLNEATDDMNHNIPSEDMPEESVSELNSDIADDSEHEEHAPMMPEVSSPEEARKARLRKAMAK